MTLGPFEITALVTAVVGIAVAFAGRWKPGLGVWARALIMSACAIGACAFMWSGGWTLNAFVAGFLVCAALHRWIDVFASRDAEETA